MTPSLWSPCKEALQRRSLITVDQRALHLDGGEVTFSIAAASGNMAKMIYGAEDREVGNGASEDVN